MYSSKNHTIKSHVTFKLHLLNKSMILSKKDWAEK